MIVVEVFRAGEHKDRLAIFYTPVSVKMRKTRWLRSFHLAILLLIYKLFGVKVSINSEGSVIMMLNDEADKYVRSLLMLNPYKFRKHRSLFDESDPRKVLEDLVLTVIANEISH